MPNRPSEHANLPKPNPQKKATDSDQNVKNTDAKSKLYSSIFNVESSGDPVSRMADILSDGRLSEEDKIYLMFLNNTRFKNRRTMAYMSLSCLILLFIIIMIGILVDGLTQGCSGVTCREGILAVMNEHNNIIIWVSGFFTSIIAAYFGATIIRPSS